VPFGQAHIVHRVRKSSHLAFTAPKMKVQSFQPGAGHAEATMSQRVDFLGRIGSVAWALSVLPISRIPHGKTTLSCVR
jgi:hypothetical protein